MSRTRPTTVTTLTAARRRRLLPRPSSGRPSSPSTGGSCGTTTRTSRCSARAVTRSRAWPVVGLAMHAANGAVFGLAYHELRSVADAGARQARARRARGALSARRVRRPLPPGARPGRGGTRLRTRARSRRRRGGTCSSAPSSAGSRTSDPHVVLAPLAACRDAGRTFTLRAAERRRPRLVAARLALADELADAASRERASYRRRRSRVNLFVLGGTLDLPGALAAYALPLPRRARRSASGVRRCRSRRRARISPGRRRWTSRTTSGGRSRLPRRTACVDWAPKVDDAASSAATRSTGRARGAPGAA